MSSWRESAAAAWLLGSRADHLFRGVLPCLFVCDLDTSKWGGPGSNWSVALYKENLLLLLGIELWFPPVPNLLSPPPWVICTGASKTLFGPFHSIPAKRPATLIVLNFSHCCSVGQSRKRMQFAWKKYRQLVLLRASYHHCLARTVVFFPPTSLPVCSLFLSSFHFVPNFLNSVLFLSFYFHPNFFLVFFSLVIIASLCVLLHTVCFSLLLLFSH
jgi:hypothetical protein